MPDSSRAEGLRSAARAYYARNEHLDLEEVELTDRLAQMQVSQQPGHDYVSTLIHSGIKRSLVV